MHMYGLRQNETRPIFMRIFALERKNQCAQIIFDIAWYTGKILNSEQFKKTFFCYLKLVVVDGI